MRTLFLYDPLLLPFLFPGYRVVDSPASLQGGMEILRGAGTSIPEYLETEADLILWQPIMRVDLDLRLLNRERVVMFLAEKYHLKSVPAVLDRVAKLTDFGFREWCSQVAVWSRWPKPSAQDESTYPLFVSMLQGRIAFCQVWFRCVAEQSPAVVWSSVLTFLGRTRTYDEQSRLSDRYRELLYRGRQQFGDYLPKLVPLLNLKRPTPSHLLDALLQITGGS